MAGGKSFHNATVSFASDAVADITAFDISQGAEEIENFADNRVFPQEGATVRGEVSASFTSYDLSILKDSGGTVARGDSGALVITAVGNGTAKDVICTMSRVKCTSTNVSGGYGQAAQVKADFRLQGSGGTEPTVVWTSAA